MVKEGIVWGHRISSKGIEFDKAKVEVIKILTPPISIKGIRSFIGHVGFYRSIKDFLKIAHLLCKLLKKRVNVIAFEEFKKEVGLRHYHY